MEINIDGKSIFIEKSEEETNLLFYKRCWFISKNKPKTKEEYEKINSISKIWLNQKFLGCKYNQETENILKKCKI